MGKSCLDCRWYGSVNTEDKLNPDKTVTKGKLSYEFCLKGQFYLSDHKPCEMYKELQWGEHRSVRIMPPPIPIEQKELNEIKKLKILRERDLECNHNLANEIHKRDEEIIKYIIALREIDTHIRDTPEPVPYIIETLKKIFPEYEE